jgi:cytochrome c oxidase subunit IV
MAANTSGDDHKKGEMDIHEHKSSYDLFMTFTKWGSLFVVTVVSFLVLLLSVKAGVLAAFIVAGLVAVGGFTMLKK